MHVYKVIIIGSGVAGLGAARYLQNNGVDDFLILEAQDKIGGRINTVQFGRATDNKESLVELGAQWIHGSSNNFFKLVKESGFLHENTSWEGEGDFLTPKGERIEDEKVDEIINWVDEQLDNIEKQFQDTIKLKSKSITDQVKEIKPISILNGHQQSQESVGSYLRINFQKLIQEKHDDNQDVRLKEALFQWTQNFQRIDNSCNQMTGLSLHRWAEFEENPGEQYNNFLGGAQAMINSTSKKFLTIGNLKLSSPVQQINWQTEEIQVLTTNNQLFLCHSVIVTCSIGVLQEEKCRLFQPNLPSNISSAIDSTGFGPVTKLYLEWDQPWWPKECKGFQFLWPQEFINCCDHDYKDEDTDQNKLKDTWYKSITGFDPVLNNSNTLLAWLGGPESIYLENLDDNIIKSKCTEILRNFTRLDIPSPKAVLVSRWNSNSYFRGAYSFRSTKGDQVPGDICAVLKLPIFHHDDESILKPALIFAGEALHKTHYSTLHGAFSSGEEQAELLLKLLNGWQEARVQFENNNIDIPVTSHHVEAKT